MRHVLVLALVPLGAAAMVAGERDDSPGLGGIGLLLILGSIAWTVRRQLRIRRGTVGR
ncbi:MAG: hypothetical protein JWM86_2810 [Thermoleophilia bacterium]|nr:hypothetical protein [Thermoleophilia bacterium]